MPPAKNFYKTLQVDPTAEPEVIEAAYKRLSLKYHPDTNPSPDATPRMQEINEAYQVLRDPESRHEYDRSLRSSGASSGSGSPSSSTYEPGARRQTPPRSSPKSVSRGQALAEMITSLTFPVVFTLCTFVLFRLIRPYSLISIGLVLILSGVIAYSANQRVYQALRRRD